jgi:hypothetical protein
MTPLIVVAFVLFAWGALGVALATVFWAADSHHREGRSCRPPMRDFVQFGVLAWLWPVLVPWLVFRGLVWCLGGGRSGGGRSGLVVRLVLVDGDGDGLVSGGVVGERVVR